jgi:hypothetical protein
MRGESHGKWTLLSKSVNRIRPNQPQAVDRDPDLAEMPMRRHIAIARVRREAVLAEVEQMGDNP